MPNTSKSPGRNVRRGFRAAGIAPCCLFDPELQLTHWVLPSCGRYFSKQRRVVDQGDLTGDFERLRLRLGGVRRLAGFRLVADGAPLPGRCLSRESREPGSDWEDSQASSTLILPQITSRMMPRIPDRIK